MNCRFSWGEGLKDRREKGFVVSNMTLTHAHTLHHFGTEVNPSILGQSIFGHPIVFLFHHTDTTNLLHTVNSTSVILAHSVWFTEI
jgi:hypothetical protein